MLAGMGAAGAVTSAGTPLLIQAKQQAESELENLMIGYEGATQASRLRSEANLQRTQGKIYGQKAKTARTASYIGAGSTLLTGFSKSPKFQAAGSGVPPRSALTAPGRTSSGGFTFG